MLAASIFILTYIGVALGRIPGLVIDRVGIALLGAIGMIVCGVLTTETAVSSIDLPTILLLYSLMVVSAQLRLGGFYTWAALKMTLLLGRPRSFLLVSMLVNQLHTMGADLHDLLTLTGVSTVLSNLFSNVPATMLLVRFLDAGNPVEWYTLAVSSTFAGNLIIIGSIANLIVIEQASNYGIKISFKEHAAVGIPVTLFSLAVLVIWMHA